MPDDIAYSRKLGPLTPLVGEWEGDAGIDISYHNKDDETSRDHLLREGQLQADPGPGERPADAVGPQLRDDGVAPRRGGDGPVPRRDRVPAVGQGQRPGHPQRRVRARDRDPRRKRAEPRDKVLRFDAKPGEPVATESCRTTTCWSARRSATSGALHVQRRRHVQLHLRPAARSSPPPARRCTTPTRTRCIASSAITRAPKQRNRAMTP